MGCNEVRNVYTVVDVKNLTIWIPVKMKVLSRASPDHNCKTLPKLNCLISTHWKSYSVFTTTVIAVLLDFNFYYWKI